MLDGKNQIKLNSVTNFALEKPRDSVQCSASGEGRMSFMRFSTEKQSLASAELHHDPSE